MQQVIIQGRGGQGAQTAGNLLSEAFFAEGKHVQSFASYGGARRGTPVSSFIRIDDRPIRVRSDIDKPDAILCFDASLLEGKEGSLLRLATPDTLIVVNSARSAADLKGLGNFRIVPIDGIAISQQNQLGRIVNSALLGAFVFALGAPTIESMNQTLAASVPKKKDENMQACLDGYARAKELLSA
jgi:pyruvate ferredoxin oxidoreductase gamma subunit